MTGNDIRKSFLEYFESKGHTRVSASSLVPQDDPTLLFTNSGMVQFKKVFMGEETRPYTRATTAQSVITSYSIHYTKLYDAQHWLRADVFPDR